MSIKFQIDVRTQKIVGSVVVSETGRAGCVRGRATAGPQTAADRDREPSALLRAPTLTPPAQTTEDIIVLSEVSLQR